MLVYTLRRLLAMIPVLLAASIFSFLLVDLAGDPLADLRVQVPPVPDSTIQAAEERLYRDRTTPERYWIWLTGVELPGGYGANNGDIGLLQGKWGPSNSGVDIAKELGDRFVITIRLVLAATFLGFLLGVVTGVISAVKQYSKTDHVLTFAGFLGLAMPIFWLAALIKEAGVWVNLQLGTRIFYTFGATSPGYDRLSTFEKISDVAGHMILPTLALMLNGYAVIGRFQRASMLEVLNSDYVRLARAKGLRNRLVMRRHALRTALIPVVTLGALAVSGALTGVVVTETIFQWRGLGTFLTSAVFRVDAYSVMGFLVVAGVLIVVMNLVADLLYAVLDPRIRYE
jgi:peptide/nickel transport system permease protein